LGIIGDLVLDDWEFPQVIREENRGAKSMTPQDDKPELVFADLPPGRTFRLLEYPLSRELVREYMETVGDRHPLYGEGLAPPGLAAIYARLSYLQDHSMPSGGVLAKQEFEFHHPLRIGDILQVGAKVIESYLDEKKRKRVTFFIEARNQEDKVVSTIRVYALWPK